MTTIIKNCTVDLLSNGKILYISLPKNPDLEVMKKMGRGRPCHGYYSLSLEYVVDGISYFLHR